MSLTEPQAVYYGLQQLATSDKLWSDRMFITRAACIPVEDWTVAIWNEAARVVGNYRNLLTTDVSQFPAIQRMTGQPPVEMAYLEAEALTPRPSAEQLARVRELAAELNNVHPTRTEFAVYLEPELGFAIVRRHRLTDSVFHLAANLPGATEVPEGFQVWLCSELRDFCIRHSLSVDPRLFSAIAMEEDRINQHGAYALALEKAATCARPENYPPQLLEFLKEMRVKGLEVT